MKSLYYRLGKVLSEGKGRQLAWLVGILSLVLLLILVVIGLFFNNQGIQLSNVLALFFGVDSLNDTAGLQTIIMLIIALLGTLLFSTFLISVITNIVDNVSESYREGRINVKLSSHTVFLGASHQLIGMLSELSKKKDSKEILILTTSNVDELRARVYSHFDGSAYTAFRKRIVFRFGERDKKDDLVAACAKDAEQIFILGEDNELAHDSLSISAVNILADLCTQSTHDVQCVALLEDHISTKAFVMKGKVCSVEEGSRLRLNLIDRYDYIAEKVLTANNCTPIDHVVINKDDTIEVQSGIGKDTLQYVHLVITGSGLMAEAFARTAFAMLHFPNFDERTLERRTVISLISPDAEKQMETITASNENIFKISHYRFIGNGTVKEYAPDADYGDFMDVEWEFIEGNLQTPFVRDRLFEWVGDSRQSVSIALCDSNSTKNATDALSLPRVVFSQKVPVYVFQDEDTNLLELASHSVVYKDSIITFGSVNEQSFNQDDPLFAHRFDMARRVNFAYSKAYGVVVDDEADAWNGISENDKLSSTYNALSIPLKVRSFGIDVTRPIEEQLSAYDRNLLDRVEHRRWNAGVLLLGSYPMDKKQRKEFSDTLLSSSDPKQLKDEQKANFFHWDLESYDAITTGEQAKDAVLMHAIPYIVTGNRDLL